MYKTFTEWKKGNWLEDGEPRKEAYTKDELLLVEMGWKYGFDAGKAQQADRIAELEKQSKPVAWMEYIQGEEWEIWYVEPTDLPKGHTYKPLYLAPQTKPAPEGLIDPKSYYIGYEDGKKAPQIKPLSDEEIYSLLDKCIEYTDDHDHAEFMYKKFARAIEERHGIK